MTIEGTVLDDRYAVGELLGRGGMAEVYLATDRVLDRQVAVKVLGGWLAHDGTFVERFRREALASARISHPALVAVFDAGSEDGMSYIVMELVPGETLAEVIAREGRLPPDQATRIGASVAEALAVAHAAGIVHRDVKPANVMLTPDGRTKLMDLGIARDIGGKRLTRASSILGTAGYISPEQARGDPVDHRSDIYSLGCVMYEMLTGRRPFVADDPVAVAYQHVHQAPAPPASVESSVPAALDAVILRAMEKDPAARFQSAADMRSALIDQTVPIAPLAPTTPLPVDGTTPLPTVGAPETLARRAGRPPRRRSSVPILVAIAVLILLGALAFALFGGDPPSGSTASRTPSASPSPTPSPSPSTTRSPSPSPAVVDPVQEAAAALEAIVAEGVADGSISEAAAAEIRNGLDEALGSFGDGDTEEAIERLGELGAAIDELVDQEEIHHSQERKLDKAIEDLVGRMEPSEED
jgi:eukaryotic-like serine/threonine-protein kinase